ncbi:MAG: hypothetical protein QF535_15430, partial [Anaerolineales bacterium]|nr:hypothetical protein [Anaerolineales bacterium]
VNYRDQTADSGTTNQSINIDAYKVSDNTKSHVVHLRQQIGGVAGDTHIDDDFTDTANVATNFAGGSSTPSVTNPYTVAVNIEKLRIAADADSLAPTYNPIECDAISTVNVFAPIILDRLEIKSDLPDMVGSLLKLYNEATIHDGFISGGYIDMTEHTAYFNQGTGSDPTGGLQWVYDTVAATSGARTQGCWGMGWPTEVGVIISDIDVGLRNPVED